MSDFVFVVAKGKFVANSLLPATNDALALELFNSTNLETDLALDNRLTVNDITSGTSATTVKCDSTNYAARTDASCGTTNGSATVTDTSITALDAGKGVTGSNVPAGTYVGTVTAGVSFKLSSSQTAQVDVNATGTGTVSLVIGGAVPLSGITVTPDYTNDWQTCDANDVQIPFLGGATNHAIGKAAICYDPDTTVSGTHDSSRVPQTGHDFSATPDGSTLIASISNFGRAA